MGNTVIATVLVQLQCYKIVLWFIKFLFQCKKYLFCTGGNVLEKVDTTQKH